MLNQEETKVIALCKYDLFPYFIVETGLLKEDGTVWTSINAYFKKNSVLQTEIYNEEKLSYYKGLRESLVKDYREKEYQLRIQLLEDYDIVFHKIALKEDEDIYRGIVNRYYKSIA